MVLSEDTYLIVGSIKSWKKNLAKGLTTLVIICVRIIANSVINSVTSKTLANFATPQVLIIANFVVLIIQLLMPSSVLRINPALKHVMLSGLTIYGISEAAEQIASVTEEFPEI